MLFAENEIRKNAAEYVLYLWQMEDMLRALEFDLNKVREILESNRDAEEVQIRRELTRYELLINEMRSEAITIEGHLSRSLRSIADLYLLHQNLLMVKKDPDYQALYQLALPNIQEFITRSGRKGMNELEACFHALYGLLVLRLKKEPISRSTEQAMGTFSKLLAYLAARYQVGNEKLN